MKNICYACLVLSNILLLHACNHSDIPTGHALVSGKFSDAVSGLDGNSATITLSVSNPVLDHPIEYEAQSKEDGTFTFDIPVVYPVYAIVSFEEFNEVLLLTPDKETKFEIIPDESGRYQIKMFKGELLTKEDDKKSKMVTPKFITITNTGAEKILSADIHPYVYRDSMLHRMEKDFKTLEKEYGTSGKALQSSYYNTKLFCLKTVFDYALNMRLIFKNQHPGEEIDTLNFTPAKPDKSYYSFLKYFDLDHPMYFMLDYYSGVLQDILSYEALNIPPIGDTPTESWIKEAKANLSDLLGFDSDIFYDFFAANAYSRQMINDLNPLSDKQKENIKVYFRNKAIVEILLSENEKIKEIASLKVNKTPDVPKEELMDAIIANYKGKVVVVDFWATWCGPCLEAMRQSKDIKNELEGRDVVFVYMAGTSSAINLWKRQILETEGEHYYLNKSEWEYLFDKYHFYAIPTYLFFDATGEFKNKITGFPGTKRMREMIEELIP